MNFISRGFIFSFLLHIGGIGLYYLYFYAPKVYAKELKTVSISLAQIVPEKVLQEQPKEIEKKELIKKEPIKKKKIVKKKFVKKKAPVIKPKPKPVEKKLVKKVIQQTSKQSVKKKEPIKKEIVENKVVKPDFIQTNFAVIRDRVLQKLIYPRIAKKMGYSGVVELELIINSQGKLLDARIKRSSGKSVLDKAALKAANKLKAQILPKPQSITTVVLPVSFRLKS